MYVKVNYWEIKAGAVLECLIRLVVSAEIFHGKLSKPCICKTIKASL